MDTVDARKPRIGVAELLVLDLSWDRVVGSRSAGGVGISEAIFAVEYSSG
jgi:hypothetical protein